jgi:hypothetical protein
MWCLLVSIACPDYKRPSVDTNIYFFETKQEALNKLKMCKIIFIADFDTTEDPRIESLTEDSPGSLLEELFEKVIDPDTFYRCSYMENDPFYSNLIEVKPGAIAISHPTR